VYRTVPEPRRVRYHHPSWTDHQTGATLVRWTAVEAAHSVPRSAAWLTSAKARIGERRRDLATVAVARKLLTLVYYGLRDGHIRALRPAKAAA
jgi:hypothetical protein